MIKIAVIGGGTAGYIAAAHLTKHFPKFKLYHIYDSKIPSIGVGEGTLPIFVSWLKEISELEEADLELSLKNECDMTKKWGIKFENWGDQHNIFINHFSPHQEGFAYHISAHKIVNFLQKYIKAEHIDAKVINLETHQNKGKIIFENRNDLEVDFIIDARGFPRYIEGKYFPLSFSPTNAALIRQGSIINEGLMKVQIGDKVFNYQSLTRSIARPHGWIFMIPLTSRNSYGYIYNKSINTLDEIRADFEEFIKSENLCLSSEEKHLDFPSFCCQEIFDGTVLKIGNSASFLEPLQATAIGIILTQMMTFSYGFLKAIDERENKGQLNQENIQVFNRYFWNYFQKIGLFVGFHYANGSQFDTAFWQYARSNWAKQLKNPAIESLLGQWNQILPEVNSLPHPLAEYDLFLQKNKTDYRLPIHHKNFAVWDLFSIAEILFGIGYLSKSPELVQ
jgi:tryptophan halogenase